MIIITDYFHFTPKVMIKLLIFFEVMITITITFPFAAYSHVICFTKCDCS